MRVMVWPRYVGYRVMRRVIGETRALCGVVESVSKKSGTIGVLYRAAIYKRILKNVGSDVSIGFGTCFSKVGAVLEDKVYLGRHCSIGWVEIGKGAKIADGVQILSGKQQHASEYGDVLCISKVKIGAGAWIGAGAIVMADVGEGAVVGAGSVVTKAVEANMCVVGNPARRIQSNCPISKYHEDHSEHIRSRVA